SPLQYSNSNIQPVYIGQFNDTVATFQLQSLMPTFSTVDSANLAYNMGYNGGPPAYLQGGSFMPLRAVDVDGDGLPDMTFIPGAGSQSGQFQTYFSTRDRFGQTHPFGAAGASYCPSVYMDPSLTEYAKNGQSGRALADVDGDGLADEIIVNKF